MSAALNMACAPSPNMWTSGITIIPPGDEMLADDGGTLLADDGSTLEPD